MGGVLTLNIYDPPPRSVWKKLLMQVWSAAAVWMDGSLAVQGDGVDMVW